MFNEHWDISSLNRWNTGLKAPDLCLLGISPSSIQSQYGRGSPSAIFRTAVAVFANMAPRGSCHVNPKLGVLIFCFSSALEQFTFRRTLLPSLHCIEPRDWYFPILTGTKFECTMTDCQVQFMNFQITLNPWLIVKCTYATKLFTKPCFTPYSWQM